MSGQFYASRFHYACRFDFLVMNSKNNNDNDNDDNFILIIMLFQINDGNE